MLYRFVTFALFFSITSPAIASTHLKIIGRGLENKKTHHVIALACVGEPTDGSIVPSCKTLRHVELLPTSKRLVYIGNAIQFDHEPTEAELFQSVKEINAAVKKYRKQSNSGHRNLQINRVMAGITLGAGIATGASPAFAVFSLPLLATVVPLYFLFNQTFFPTHGVLTNVMMNQDGWNWSSRPKPISDRSFNWVSRYLHSAQQPTQDSAKIAE